MRVLVCLKQVVDVTQIRVDSSTGQLILSGIPRKISDFDKNALEEAVKIKEKFGGEVVAVTVTSEDAKSTLREALAIGADKAYMIYDSALENSDITVTTFVLAEAIKKLGNFDLILCGEATIDGYSGQVGPRLAEILGIPVITYARKIEIENGSVTVERSLEDSTEVVRSKTPVLITVVREINEPRIPSLMAIMKASKKELNVWGLEDLGIPKEKVGLQGSAIKILEVKAPKVERKGIKIEGETPEEIADKLVKALMQEGVIGR